MFQLGAIADMLSSIDIGVVDSYDENFLVLLIDMKMEWNYLCFILFSNIFWRRSI